MRSQGQQAERFTYRVLATGYGICMLQLIANDSPYFEIVLTCGGNLRIIEGIDGELSDLELYLLERDGFALLQVPNLKTRITLVRRCS
jgi:hypothetical protein